MRLKLFKHVSQISSCTSVGTFLCIFLGTNTGMALNYVTRTLLKRGNRRQAKDVVLLITDGESNDRVAIPAIQLRRTGAIVSIFFAKKNDDFSTGLNQTIFMFLLCFFVSPHYNAIFSNAKIISFRKADVAEKVIIQM